MSIVFAFEKSAQFQEKLRSKRVSAMKFYEYSQFGVSALGFIFIQCLHFKYLLAHLSPAPNSEYEKWSYFHFVHASIYVDWMS